VKDIHVYVVYNHFMQISV